MVHRQENVSLPECSLFLGVLGKAGGWKELNHCPDFGQRRPTESLQNIITGTESLEILPASVNFQNMSRFLKTVLQTGGLFDFMNI